MNDLIQWPRAKYWDRAWNPVIGCRPCSPACENCYAKAWAGRFGKSFEPHETNQRPPRSGVVFCGNMTDLFGEWVRHPCNPICYTGEDRGDGATYLYLTKRAERMFGVLRNKGITRFSEELGREAYVMFASGNTLRNHYFGFTAENQEWYDRRIGALAGYDVRWEELANLWISCEPLLGPINLRLEDYKMCVRWVVVGCESGHNRRPCKIEWVEDIVQQCRNAGVRIFVKQLDIGGRCERDITKFPEHLQIRQVPWASENEGGEK